MLCYATSRSYYITLLKLCCMLWCMLWSSLVTLSARGCYVMLCYVVLCYAVLMLCYAMLAVLTDPMLSYTIQYYFNIKSKP